MAYNFSLKLNKVIKPPPEQIIQKDKYYYFRADPDHDLLHWEKWIKIRKEEVKTLGKATQRHPDDLVVSLVDNVRKLKENKQVLEEAQLEQKPRMRGGLMEPPQRLRTLYCDCGCEPAYIMKRTKAERHQPRVMEHVGIPRHINVMERNIRGISHRAACKLAGVEYKKYLDKRLVDLREKILKIDPYKPDISELIVVGSKPKPPPPPPPVVPMLMYSVYKDPPIQDPLQGVVALRVNNTVIIKTIPGQNLTHLRKLQLQDWHETCTSWSYHINVPIKVIGRSKLYLENLGTVALKYCWRKLKRPIPFIPDEVPEQTFFFCKNEDVVSPGQNKTIYFTFVSDNPGIYTEYWQLDINNASLFDTPSQKIVLSLIGDSVEDMQLITDKIDAIRSGIIEKSREVFIAGILKDICNKATSWVEAYTVPYKDRFLERDIFIMKNPVYYYHQTEVQMLKDLYTMMNPQVEWDLSISSWREEMKTKEFVSRMSNYGSLKGSHRVLLRPWDESEDLYFEKLRAGKALLGTLANQFEMEYMRAQELYNTMSIVYSEYLADINIPHRVSPAKRKRDRTVMRHTFYMIMYDHVAKTMESFAAVISSIELNRWVDINFCR